MSEFLPLLRTLLIGGVLSAVALKMLSRPLSDAALRLDPQLPAARFWVLHSQLVLAGVPSAVGLVAELLTRTLPLAMGLQFTLAICVIAVILVTGDIAKRVERLAFAAGPASSGTATEPPSAPRAEWRLGS